MKYLAFVFSILLVFLLNNSIAQDELSDTSNIISQDTLATQIIASQQTESVESDTSSIGGENAENDASSKFIEVSSFESFYNEFLPALPDTFAFPDWSYIEIHDRKYDFYNVQDTNLIVLADTFGCGYSHPVNNRVTSHFGVRKWRFHYGTDVKLTTGDPVYAAFDGIVRISKYSKTYGNVVVIRHDNGLETLYAHLSKRLVDADSLVHSGETIGLGGNTGRSYGAHLHFEVRYFDEAIDPEQFIDFENYCLKSDTLLLNKEHYKYKEQVAELEKIVFHTIRKGDTLSHLSCKYGTSVSAICALNGMSRNKVLRIGQKIRVR